jgi:inner membrane protein
MFILGHLGTAAAPGSLAARWWGDRKGYEHNPPDLRWLIAGSILPDLIDKPLGQRFLKPYFKNGRIYCHTAVFALLVLAAGAARLRRDDDQRLFLLALGVVCHHLGDRIWNEPETAWWPARGPFIRHQRIKTILGQIMGAARDPEFWVGEITGTAFLLFSMRHLGIKGCADMGDFVRRGLSPYLARERAGG